MPMQAFALLALLTATPRIEDLAFIAGYWKGHEGVMSIEEVWSKPSGGALISVF